MTYFVGSNNLIIDLGMNNGDDTHYYLKKGYNVVALEANPDLCDIAKVRFATEIQKGMLTILNAAIWKLEGERTFFVNINNDHWSSLDEGWAGRDESEYRKIVVDCVTLSYLFSTYGIPAYLKIDVEGVDEHVLQQLSVLEYVPLFTSVEDCRFGYKYMSVLNDIGYDGFKILDQSTVNSLTDSSIMYTFQEGASGPFGNDIPGQWLDYYDIVNQYSTTVRDLQGNRIAPRTQWWDIHCTVLDSEFIV